MIKAITKTVIFLSAVWSAAAAGTIAAKFMKSGKIKRPDGTEETLYLSGKNKKGGFAAVTNKTPAEAAKAVTKKYFKK